ncbi:N-6 DNA methylase [Dysgonomonas sp. HDW5B]|uniref:N-6 DNA methylase n=1 Tax=Dysgonomonas sp. HDW5B TaxID=2714927 RepID=UPI001409389E|nr:N-6 DNA methylase [Dysgonomonas sp. HDW5B]QIK52911.1 N-6 DNA methylase [Dysgonomonas sp. HDW5B]
MLQYRRFFTDLGFDFERNLKSTRLVFEKSLDLTSQLENTTFYYHSPNNTNTSFYLVATSLVEEDLKIVRRYIWNKNDADLLFYIRPNSDDIVMSYAKYSPLVDSKESILYTFNASKPDIEKIETIRHWQFDSGTFWLNYHSFIDKTKYKGIDKELASTLKALKDQLSKLLFSLIVEEHKRDEVVQAIIDRTLYIKYLEDNHIINSTFYRYYFNNESLDYKQLLNEGDSHLINKLFKEIHAIFNNNLFDHPTIKDEFLTKEVCSLIAQSFNLNFETKQLRLFDFQFNVLPIEFISYIYEVFLSEKQKENGIYYTPKKLAQLIIDDVIINNELGSVLDPSCGSGMFLIIAFQRLLEIARNKGIEPIDNLEKIRFRTELLSKNIFGIEKEKTAQRFTLFSLSLQIFRDIDPVVIKEYIAHKLEENNKIDLFSEFSFFENIKCANTLQTKSDEIPFKEITFNYIVGNPPFFEIPDTKEYNTEILFLNNYKINQDIENPPKAGSVVKKNQISQCFFLKIKDWSNFSTRFGFVSNSSSFYNDSVSFQKYFYSFYSIEKFYELSKVKKILFEKAKESVISIIFTNKDVTDKEIIDYYSVDLGLFSEKPFELLIIEEDKSIKINQSELRIQKIKLRDFLIGNEFDRALIARLDSLNTLGSLLNIKGDSLQGLTRKSNKEIAEYWGIAESDFKKMNLKIRKKYQKDFDLAHYLSKEKSSSISIPFLYEYSNITPFSINQCDGYINIESVNNENFQRARNPEIFRGCKILLTRVGNIIKAVYTPNSIVFSVNIFGIKLHNSDYGYFITALLNSTLINYIFNIRDKKRIGDNLPRIDGNIIKNIPIPKYLDENIVSQISEISRKLTIGEYRYDAKKEELNDLIFDLYELTYIEKQRIRDSFSSESKKKIGRKYRDLLDNYKLMLADIINPYLINPVSIDFTPADFDLIVMKVSLNQNPNLPPSDKVKRYILNEIFEQNPNENFLTGQERIFGRDCVYIVKRNINENWTETKAFEDGQYILKQLISN